jgi:uncharacterized membrane protein YkvA (DUF1232 family)
MDISLLSSKLEGFARRVGKSAARTPLLLYYVLQSKDTSLKDKAIIATCLAYVILPIDLIPTSKFSLLGWADEILSIEIVFDRMRKYITPEMNSKAEKQLNKWIPQNNSSVVSQIQSQGIIGSTLQQYFGNFLVNN